MTFDPSSTSFAQRSGQTACTGAGIVGLQRAGMLDWPGRVAATAFLTGCNLRCPYCHNPELVSRTAGPVQEERLLSLVRDRRAWLDGVVITGGEPCLDEALPALLATLKREGMPVKLDTNGTCPEVLERLISERLVDFVALDVKANAERYERATGLAGVWPLVERSIEIILASNLDHEFRTTCYPLAVGPEDVVRIAALLHGGRRYVLQQFRPLRTLDAAAVSVRPHSADTLFRVAERCSSHIPTIVRGASS